MLREKPQRLRYHWADPLTMLGTHKLLNSIIVIAYCSACALVARLHVQYELCYSPLSPPFLFAALLLFQFYVFFIDSFVCYLKSLGLIELRVQRLFAVFSSPLNEWGRDGKDRWKDNKNGRMQQISYQPFGQIAWFDSTKNRKDELFLLCSELLPIVWFGCMQIMYSVHCNKVFSRHWNFTAGKVNKYIDRGFAIEFASQWSQSMRAKIGWNGRRKEETVIAHTHTNTKQIFNREQWWNVSIYLLCIDKSVPP